MIIPLFLVPMVLIPNIVYAICSPIVIEKAKTPISIEELEPPSTLPFNGHKLTVEVHKVEEPINDTEGLKRYAKEQVSAKWGENHWQAFDTIVTNESGWQVGIKNKTSGSCGIGQALPCSKMGNLYGNPKGEVDWTIEYIEARYGNPIQALAFWRSHRWY